MPRKRKSLSASPQRRVSLSGSSLVSSSSAGLPLPPTMSNNRAEVFSSMCEMFPNLDASLVEMVLSEYKEVETVMDYLLELSTATKGNTQESAGFDKIVSLLDDFQLESQVPENIEDVPNQMEEQQGASYVDKTICNDLDTLLDEALDRYGLNIAESLPNLEQCEGGSLLHSVVKPELDLSACDQNTSFPTDDTILIDQSEADNTYASGSDVADVEYEMGTSLLVSETGGLVNIESDFNTLPDMMIDSVNHSDCGAMHSQEKVGDVEKPTAEAEQLCTGPVSPASHVKSPSSTPKSQTKWNPMASSFFPVSNINPPFIAPVAVTPSQWTYIPGRREPVGGFCYNLAPAPFVWNFNHFPQTHWNTGNIKPINMAPIAPQIFKKVTPLVGKVLVLLRGAPGSGKSTLARLLLEQNPAGVILSTDDFFRQSGDYKYDVSLLGEAHEWNYKRAKDTFEKNVSPIIIDNTNLQGWEMKPYVSMAMKHKYKVTFREPDTWWKYKPKELERRNSHGVKKEKIIRMLDHFERVTVNSILNLSHPNASKNDNNSQRKTEEEKGALNILQQCLTEEDSPFSKTPESGSMTDMGSAAPDIQNSLEVSNINQELFPDVAKLEQNNLIATEDDNSIDIIQLVQNINTENKEDCSTDDASVDKQGPDIESGSSLLNERPELFSFVGDWPVEQTMSQRAPRSRKARARHERHNSSVQKDDENDKTAVSGAEEIDQATEHEQIDNRSSEKDQLTEAVALNIEHHIDSISVDYGSEEHLLRLKNQFCNSLILHNKEDGAEEGKTDGMFVDKISDIQEHLAENTYCEDIQYGTSVNKDVKIKRKQSKRNCRHCRLALNFTNKHEESECLQQSSMGLCKFSQTEPQDFALAWRVERRNSDISDSAKVLIGKNCRFVSKSLDGSPDAQEHIPYRVMQHKSTFVEEGDLISLGDEDSLDILYKLFRSLSFDVLKDLFERCNKDIVWTTNLLLDSGEKMYKEDECESGESEDSELCSYSDSDNLPDNSSVPEEKSATIDEENSEYVEKDVTDFSLKAPEYSPFGNTLPLIVAEELKNGNVLSSNEIILGQQCRISSEFQELFPSHETITDTIAPELIWSSDLETEHSNLQESSLCILQNSNISKTIDKGNKEDFNLNDGNLCEKSDSPHPEILEVKNNEEQGFTEVTAVVEEENKLQNKNISKSQSNESLQFDYLQLTLPPEFAFQLTELFGPVGIDPGSLTIEDCVVPIDLKLAESIHKKWKESIMERHRQEALSYQLIFQDDPVDLDTVPQKSESGVSQRNTDLFPFMDQWNTRIKKVSLREIIAEEMALQAHEDSKKSLSSKNCAVKLKEKQLLELFPNVEPQLLLDIFEENNYSLEKTEQFMSSVLEADPVQNVIAQGFTQAVSTATEKNKEKKLKPDKEIVNERYFQDLEYPNYDDFRAEAYLYHQKQQESYRKATEAHNRGMKQVAAYYAQQGYLYGQKMKEENRRAAVHIFERANEYLLPENILDLHGLHVDEAMKHFRKVLQDKTDEFKQNGGKSHLLVITGRGNHSQGGVPRIKPAVIDFLTNHDYRFQEKTPGVLRVALK